MSLPSNTSSMMEDEMNHDTHKAECTQTSNDATVRWVWGSNGSGCLGIGHCQDLYQPTPIHDQVEEQSQLPSSQASSLRPFKAISCGGCHTLARDGQETNK